MNNQVIADSASDLFKAMRSRWRTGATQASMTLSQAMPGAESSYTARRARPRHLSESNPTGVVIEESTYECPFCKNDLSVLEYQEEHCSACNRYLGESHSPMTKMTGCPKCGSHKIAGWMPTDFESAKCEECGKIYEPAVAEHVEDTRPPGQRFLRIDDCLDAFNQGWKASGIRDKNEYIRLEFVNQEKDYVRRTGTMDDHSRRVIYGESLQESSGQAANEYVPDYDPNSPEPRFLQIAKAELLRRRDLKCRDCGFTGLPASVDGNCPECGGLMNEPELQMATAASTADQIRAAIRQQVADKSQGLKRDNSTQESVHASVPNHQHDIHLSDLVAHYGFKANGDHYVVSGDSDSRLYVRSDGLWIHQHHGVHHEGHGHKSLSTHLSRYGNHRSKR